MKKLILILVIFVISCVPAFSQDTTYVTPSELEPNWGLWVAYNKFGETAYPWVNTVIETFRISPNGRYLAYYGYPFTTEGLAGQKFHIYDIKYNKEVFSTDYTDLWNYAYWFKDSINVLYYYCSPYDGNGKYTRKLLRLNLETLKIDSLLCGSKENNGYFNIIGADGKGYVTWTDTIISHGKRLLIDSSFYENHPINELIPNYTDRGIIKGYNELEQPFIPEFPPCDINYSITSILTADSLQQLSITGFSIIRNFDYQNNRKDFNFSSIPITDTSWVRNSGNKIVLGTNGEVYFSFGFTAISEIKRGLPYVDDLNPFDSSMLVARSTFGIYRIDTNWRNLVQLVRNWDACNIQVTCDGTIYYQMTNMEDTTDAIWKMNKYGKEKQMVFNLKLPQSSSVKENNFTKININLFPNPVSDYLSIDTKDIYYNQLINIYNVYGQKILECSYSDKIDVSNLLPGAYYFRLADKTIKFIKQ